MDKIPFKNFILKRINIYSIIILTTAFVLIFMLFLFINKQIRTATDEQLNFVIKKTMINYDLQLNEMENNLTSLMKEELENINSFNEEKIENAIDRIHNNTKYKHLIKNTHYFLINEKGIIEKTSYEDDLGLNLSEITVLWNNLKPLNPGQIFVQPITNENGTNFPWLYIYKKLSEDYYLEFGVDFHNDFNTIIFSPLLDFVKESETIKNIEIYSPYFESFLENKNLEVKYKEYLQTIPEGEIHYIDTGFYKSKAFYKLQSDYGYRYVTLNLDYANSRNIFFSLLILLLFVPIFIFFFMRKFIVKETDKIIKPIKATANMMKEFTENDCTLDLEKISDSKIQEIDQIKSEFLIMAKKIRNSVIQQENSNAELEELYENNELLIKKINRIIKITIESKEYENLEEFLKHLFDNIFDFIPEADYGSLSILKDGQRHFIDARGHNLEILQKIDLRNGLFVEAKDIKILDDIIEYDKQSIPKYSADLFIQASKPIKSTLIIPFNANGKVYGSMNLDIDKFSNKEFSQESIRFSKFFSDIITSYLILSEYQNLESKHKESMIRAIINLVEIHDNYTKGHSNNVSKLALEFSQKLGLERDRQLQIYWAALIHDMGKIVIPSSILNKPSRLTPEEFSEIKKHPIYAYDVLKSIDNMEDIAEYIKYHHERIDGKGYPEGLKGKEIPLESRIISICDSFDAMTSERSYKKAFTKEQAIKELINNKGIQFDEKLVDSFVKLVLKD